MDVTRRDHLVKKSLQLLHIQLADLFEQRFYIHSLKVGFSGSLIDMYFELSDEDANKFRLTLSLDPSEPIDVGVFKVYVGACTSRAKVLPPSPDLPRFLSDFSYYFVDFLTTLFNEESGLLRGAEFSKVVYYPWSGGASSAKVRYLKNKQGEFELHLGVNDLLEWGGSLAD